MEKEMKIMFDVIADLGMIRPINERKIVSDVDTYGEPVKLSNGTYGLRISQRNSFVLQKPVKIVNCSGEEFHLNAFIKKSQNTAPYWICGDTHWYTDKYFFIPCEAPRTKMTKEQIEAKLGFKVEIVG